MAGCGLLYAFDLLLLGSEDLRGLELIARGRMLRKALRKAGPPSFFGDAPTEDPAIKAGRIAGTIIGVFVYS